MNKVSFLNEKEQAAADNLLGLLAGLTAAGIVNTDVEAIAASYRRIAEAASIRHNAPPNINRIVTGVLTDLPRKVVLEDLKTQSEAADLETPVMMADGSVMPAKNIRDGDLVMEPDGSPRRVTYKIAPSDGWEPEVSVS